MKTIGLIGGMSWESTVTYYQIINRTVKERLGGFHSARCLLYSVDFHDIEKLQTAGEWDKMAVSLSKAAKTLENAGADFVAICTNTMHRVADDVQHAIDIPLLHIADAVADVLIAAGINKAGLLGTKYTMEQDFYKAKLKARGIEAIIPEEAARAEINNVIYNELCLGRIDDESRKYFLDVVDELATRGAQGAILGCTEIGLLVKQPDTSVPLFDTAEIHAEQIALFALK